MQRCSPGRGASGGAAPRGCSGSPAAQRRRRLNLVRGSGRRHERAERGSSPSPPPPGGFTLRDSSARAPGDRRGSGGAGGAPRLAPTSARQRRREEGRGECGLRVPLPPAPLPAALGLGGREAPSSGSAGLLRPPAGEHRLGRPPLPPSGVTPVRGPGAHSLRLPSGGSPSCSCRGEGRAAGEVLLLLPGVGSCCVPAAPGSVAACVCAEGEYPGSIAGSTSSPLSHRVRTVGVYYVTCD